MRINYLIAGLGICLASSAASAEHLTEKQASAAGDQTRQWLALQREGHAASQQPQPLSGPVAAKIYQRYEDSFSHPIPEFFSGDDADASVLDQ